MATTKEDVADFINTTNTNDIWTAQEAAYVQGKLDPFFAQALIIKMVLIKIGLNYGVRNKQYIWN